MKRLIRLSLLIMFPSFNNMNINRKQKKLIKVYIVICIMIFIVINWDTISWMFNYRELYGLTYDFFNPYQDSNFLVSANTNNTSIKKLITTSINDKTIYPYTEKDNSIEIPKIGIVAPIVTGESTDLVALEKNLNQGAVVYPESVAPGENGQTIILGHSAPPNWPHIKYDWIFSKINDLHSGDEITFNFNNRQYTYRVIQKDIVDRGEEVKIGAE